MAPSNPGALHRLLGIAVTVTATVFIGLWYAGRAPILREGPVILGQVISGVAIAISAMGFFVLRPRVPRRQFGQSLDEYWATPAVLASINLVWFVLEGAGTIAAVGFLLVADTTSGIVMALTIAAFWLSGPDSLART